MNSATYEPTIPVCPLRVAPGDLRCGLPVNHNGPHDSHPVGSVATRAWVEALEAAGYSVHARGLCDDHLRPTLLPESAYDPTLVDDDD